MDSGDDTLSPHLPAGSQLFQEELPPALLVLPVKCWKRAATAFPLFPCSLKGAADLTGKHLITTRPHLSRAGVAVSKGLLVSEHLWHPEVPTLPVPRHPLGVCFSIHA